MASQQASGRIPLPATAPVVSDAENLAAETDIDFFNARVGLSNERTATLCDALSRVTSDNGAKPAISRYFDRYYADDAKLLQRYPSHNHFIRYMDYQTHLLQRAMQPAYMRKVCAGG